MALPRHVGIISVSDLHAALSDYDGRERRFGAEPASSPVTSVKRVLRRPDRGALPDDLDFEPGPLCHRRLTSIARDQHL